MSERIAPQMTEEWLAQQNEIARNRRRKVVEFFDVAFQSPEIRELRAQYDPDFSNTTPHSNETNHNEFIQKKEI